MTTRAARRNAERYASNAAKREAGASDIVRIRAPRQPKEDSGLAWLAKAGKISSEQAKAGRIFGGWALADIREGQGAIPSCLGSLDSFGGGGISATPTDVASLTALAIAYRRQAHTVALGAHEDAAWLREARAHLFAVRAGLEFSGAILAALEAICVSERRPREITDNERQITEMVTSLRHGLDYVVKYLEKHDPNWRYRPA